MSEPNFKPGDPVWLKGTSQREPKAASIVAGPYADGSDEHLYFVRIDGVKWWMGYHESDLRFRASPEHVKALREQLRSSLGAAHLEHELRMSAAGRHMTAGADAMDDSKLPDDVPGGPEIFTHFLMTQAKKLAGIETIDPIQRTLDSIAEGVVMHDLFMMAAIQRAAENRSHEKHEADIDELLGRDKDKP